MADESMKQKLEKQEFRGIIIPVTADGKFGVQLNGLNPLEAYGALSLITKRLRKDFGIKN